MSIIGILRLPTASQRRSFSVLVNWLKRAHRSSTTQRTARPSDCMQCWVVGFQKTICNNNFIIVMRWNSLEELPSCNLALQSWVWGDTSARFLGASSLVFHRRRGLFHEFFRISLRLVWILPMNSRIREGQLTAICSSTASPLFLANTLPADRCGSVWTRKEFLKFTLKSSKGLPILFQVHCNGTTLSVLSYSS